MHFRTESAKTYHPKQTPKGSSFWPYERGYHDVRQLQHAATNWVHISLFCKRDEPILSYILFLQERGYYDIR